MKGPRLLYLALFFSLWLHAPTLFGFFTNDDFFHFLISKAENIKEFIAFFDPFNQPQGYGWYRPLANQIYYFIGLKIFSLNPFPMKFLMLTNHLLNIILVWNFTKVISKSELLGGIASVIYASSAALFAGLYLVGVQERPLTFFFLLTSLCFIRFLTYRKLQYYVYGFIMFIFSLWCKESAIVMPLVYLCLVWFYSKEIIHFNLKKSLILSIPMFLVVALFLFIKLFSFGLAQGDSYIWQFSPRIINTLTWYSLWSINTPEMLVDYIGPGLKINPNLFRFWGKETMVITGLLSMMFGYFGFSAWERRNNVTPDDKKLILLGLAWFLITISPVLGLPLHKFPHYLSLSLVGLVLAVSIIIHRSLTISTIRIYLISYIFIYLVNFSISTKTHWAYTGSLTAGRVHHYIQNQIRTWSSHKTIIFYDTPQDEELPWNPSEILKTVLSDNNYFELYYQGKITAKYLSQKPDKIGVAEVLIPARQFLGY